MKNPLRCRQLGLALSLVAFLFHLTAQGQSTPTPHLLTGGPFKFESWASNATAGTYPTSMVFHFTSDPEGGAYNQFSPGAGVYNCGYNLNTRSRITGLEADGISFTGSSTPQYVDCDVNNETADPTRFVGDAVVVLNTTGFTETISVQWTAETISSVERIYGIQIQYRIGTSGNFVTVPTSTEYSSTGIVAQTFQNNLPAECNDKAHVEVRWVYHYVSGPQGGSGGRPTMRLDDILISDATTVTLPVELAYFRAQSDDNQSVSLRWKTVVEKNSRDFRLERSTDAKTFTEIARLDAAGTTHVPKLYAFTDRSPAHGANYYRLRQVDRDGRQHLFRPVAVVIGSEGKGQAYPNPSDGTQFTVRSLAGFGDGIQLYDMARRAMPIQTTRLSELEVRVQPAHRLSAGLYLLGVPTEGGQTTWQRLVVR
jgi:hypothetical protein